MPCEASRVLSIVHNQTQNPSRVVQHKLNSSLVGDESVQDLLDTPGYSYFSRREAGGPVLEKRIVKRATSLNKILDVLEANKNGSSQSRIRCSKVLPECFLSRPNTSTKEKESDMTDVFIGVQFEGRNGFSSIQHIETRHCDITPSSSKFSSRPTNCKKPKSPGSRDDVSASLGSYTSITINTGTCMFSRASLAGKPKQRKQSGLGSVEAPAVPPLPKGVRPTIYELETSLRLSMTIANVLGIIGDVKNDHIPKINVKIDVPDFQYYWTACKLLHVGEVDVDYVRKWIAAIDLRRQRVGAALIKMIRVALKDRGLADMEVDVELNSGTEEVAALVKRETCVGRVPTVERAIESLTSRGPEANNWREFLSFLDEQEQPKTMDQLGKLVYCFKTVKSAFPSSVMLRPHNSVCDLIGGKRLIVQINDITDWRIFDKSKSFLRRYYKAQSNAVSPITVLGVFPMQRIFLAGPGRSNLYEDESPHGYSRSGNFSNPIKPLDIIGETYGNRAAQHLREAFRSQGRACKLEFLRQFSDKSYSSQAAKGRSGRHVEESHLQALLRDLKNFLETRSREMFREPAERNSRLRPELEYHKMAS